MRRQHLIPWLVETSNRWPGAGFDSFTSYEEMIIDGTMILIL
jgi:hypothetical protein